MKIPFLLLEGWALNKAKQKLYFLVKYSFFLVVWDEADETKK